MADLKVRILASLDTAGSVSQINNEITKIEKKVKKIKLNATISNDLSKNIEKLIRQLESLNVGGRTGLPTIASQMNTVGTQAQQATRHVSNLGTQLVNSFARGVAYSGIYTIINGFQTMANTVVEVDEKMTSLRRVMGNEPDYAFVDYLQSSIDLSNELGNKLSDVLDMQTQWGQAGYSSDQLKSLTKTAQVLQNISDLGSNDAVGTLLSGSINFSIDPGNSMEISDKLNEIDNNFSATTADLANSMRKAGASASQYGVSLDSLLGYTTAIKYMSPISVMIYEKIQ